MAIVHGNETAGLRAMNDVIEILLGLTEDPGICLVFALGNSAAARRGLRFIEADLNRSFAASPSKVGAEVLRAKQLEALLVSSRYFFDLHQTSQPSRTPFFIFPYSAEGLGLAAAVSTELPVVTHWGPSFSKDGMCTDEFVNERGGFGITIELGQNGMSEYCVGVGVRVLLRAIAAVKRVGTGRLRDEPLLSRLALYCWSQVIEKTDGAQLRAGLQNFMPVTAGEVIGSRSGGDIVAADSGFILFPVYPNPLQSKDSNELCRIIKAIGHDELPR
jgi:succinylglutamate desuccinylase